MRRDICGGRYRAGVFNAFRSEISLDASASAVPDELWILTFVVVVVVVTLAHCQLSFPICVGAFSEAKPVILHGNDGDKLLFVENSDARFPLLTSIGSKIGSTLADVIYSNSSF